MVPSCEHVMGWHMYKTSIGVAFALLFSGNVAMAACTVPNTLANGTTADATQVMANFTSITGCAATIASPSFTGNAQFSGNVGIGTSPTYSLDVLKSGASIIRNKSSSGSAQLYLDAATGAFPTLYNLINGTTHWASGMTQNGQVNAYNWYSYGMPGVAFEIRTSGNAMVAGCLTYNSGTLGTCLSDERTKRNVHPFAAGLKEIIGLEPVTYEFNGLGENDADGKVRVGLVAQQVRDASPMLVQVEHVRLKSSDKEASELLKVKYGDLTFALINSVKELKAANDNLSARIETLERTMRVRTAHR